MPVALLDSCETSTPEVVKATHVVDRLHRLARATTELLLLLLMLAPVSPPFSSITVSCSEPGGSPFPGRRV